jgi:hypothetical protein
MSYLNLNISRTAYTDSSPTTKPQLKVFDMVNVAESTLITLPSSCSRLIQPGQSDLILTTARTLSYDGTTQFVISKPYPNDYVRIRWTGGTAPSFRTLRSAGYDATTVINMSRVNTGTFRLDFVSGTMPNLANVFVGDEIFFQPSDNVFTTPLDPSYCSNFIIVDKGSDYLVFRDSGVITASTSNLTLGSDFATIVRIYSNIGVQVGDMIEFSSSSVMALDNKGTFEVLGVSDRDILIVNPYEIDETCVPGINNISVYSRMLNYLSILANGKLKIKFNPNDSWLTMQEYKTGEAICVVMASVHTVYAMNDTEFAISISVESATF